MRILLMLALVAGPLLPTVSPDYLAMTRKLALIRHDRVRPGARVVLTSQELDAYARQEITVVAPGGVRDPHVELGEGTATASALIDFGKLRGAHGSPPGWFRAHLLAGERPVTVNARIRSSGGAATVEVQRVEISGIAIEGRMLDYLIHNYLAAAYPAAKVGEPFALGHHIERLQVQPAAVDVIIGR